MNCLSQLISLTLQAILILQGKIKLYIDEQVNIIKSSKSYTSGIKTEPPLEKNVNHQPV